MKYLCRIMIFVVGICSFLNIASANSTASDKKYRIFILHSYHPEYTSVIENNKGIFLALDGKTYDGKNVLGKGLSYEYKMFFMDSKRHTSASYLEEKGLDAINAIKNYKPDVVISADDDAAMLVLKKLVGTGIPTVFCDVSGDPVKYGLVKALTKPETNITGVIERHNYADIIKLALTINPKFESVSIVIDDSTTARAEIGEITRQIKSIGLLIRKTVLTNSWSEWRRAIVESQVKNNFIFAHLYFSLKDDDDKYVSPTVVLKWLLENSRVPEFGATSFQVKQGMFASVSTWSSSQGYEAAEKAVRILKGEKVQEIPVTVSKIGSIDINLERAKKLGIEIPFDLLTYANTHGKMGIYEEISK